MFAWKKLFQNLKLPSLERINMADEQKTPSPKDSQNLDPTDHMEVLKAGVQEEEQDPVKKIVDAKTQEVLGAVRVVKSSITVVLNADEAITKLFTNQKIYVSPKDASEAPHLMFEGVWEEDITKAFMSLVEPGDTVFDLGATFGYYGIIAGSVTHSAGQKGSLHFFDPNPVYAPLIKKSLMVNGLINESVVNTLGVSQDGKPVKIMNFKDDWNSNTSVPLEEFVRYRKLIDTYTTETMQTVAIDDYVSQQKISQVGVIKMDIEGMEEGAYRGMKKTIAASPRLRLVMEFTPASYKEPEKFYNDLGQDFPYLYVIDTDGAMVIVKDYGSVQQQLRDGRWVMLVVSKIMV